MMQDVERKLVTKEALAERTRILACEPVALPPELKAATEILPAVKDRWWERLFEKLHLVGLARRSRMARRSLILFRQAPRYDAIVTLGDLEGLFFAALERFRGQNRPAHLMYDCLWYGGGSLKRAWMRFCLRAVDRCIVWASVERKRYAEAYGVLPEKFLYVPHHHTLKRYGFDVGDDGYVFTGGNSDRDYGLFFSAVRDLSVPCVLATNRPQLLAGLVVPPNVRVVSVSPAEFRQLMARARLVVMSMRATLLHAGGQQTVLNAMVMGKPVILTDPEGGADYIEHGKTGLLVPYGDVAALREAIRYLWEHLEVARAMGEQAQRAATPLTTERCNVTMWQHALRLAGEMQAGGGSASTSAVASR
jgi:glycosyltransferase involved in cell wall biosynthesis